MLVRVLSTGKFKLAAENLLHAHLPPFSRRQTIENGDQEFTSKLPGSS
jgi:hypothetical protein